MIGFYRTTPLVCEDNLDRRANPKSTQNDETRSDSGGTGGVHALTGLVCWRATSNTPLRTLIFHGLKDPPAPRHAQITYWTNQSFPSVLTSTPEASSRAVTSRIKAFSSTMRSIPGGKSPSSTNVPISRPSKGHPFKFNCSVSTPPQMPQANPRYIGVPEH